MTDRPARPAKLPAHTPIEPRPADDHGADPADLPTGKANRPQLGRPPKREIVVAFSTRVELSIADLVETVAREQGTTKRAVVEYAIKNTYGQDQ